MVKTKTTAKKTIATPTKKNVPAVKKPSSDALAAVEDFESGEGFENVTARDVIIPRINILQALSPQVQKKKAEYIEGAEIGQFCNVALGKILPNPLTLIPCFYAMIYIEWAPRNSGKGLVRIHGTDASILDQTTRDEKNKNVLPNGNYIAETATWFSLIQDEEGEWDRCFIPLSSTGLKASKRWMTKLRNEKITRPDGSKFNPAIYYRTWQASTVEETNNEGDWFGWVFEPGEPINDVDPTKALLAECKEFHRQAKVGLVRGDIEAAAKEQHEQSEAM